MTDTCLKLVFDLSVFASHSSSVKNNRNRVQESRYSQRGSAFLFTPMVDFNEMSEVGETPP